MEITCCCGCTLGSPLAQHMLTERLLCAAQRRGCPPDSSHPSHSHPCPRHRSPSLNLSPCSSVTRATLSALCPEHLTPSSLIHLLGSLPPGNVNSYKILITSAGLSPGSSWGWRPGSVHTATWWPGLRVAGQSFDLVGAMTCPEPRKSIRGVEGTWE